MPSTYKEELSTIDIQTVQYITDTPNAIRSASTKLFARHFISASLQNQNFSALNTILSIESSC